MGAVTAYVFGVVVFCGTVGLASEVLKHRERMVLAREGLERSKLRPRDQFSRAVVEEAIAGALAVVADIEPERAREHAAGLCDRLDAGIVIGPSGAETVDAIDTLAGA